MGEVVQIVGGGTPDSSNADYWDGDIDWYTPSEIGERRSVETSARKITPEGLVHSSARLLPAGSILFTSRASIGLMAFISRPSATNQGFQSLVPSNNVDSNFLYALGPYISRYAKKHAAGSTFIEISGSSLAKAPLRIPSLAEQRRIGEFFSALDGLIAAAERQEDLLKQKKQAYLQLMFPQEGETQSRLRFAGFSGDWEKRQLGELAERTGSGGTPSSANPRYYGGSIPFLSIGDITGRFVDTTQKTLTEEGLTNSAAWVVPQGAISLAMYASYGKSAILSRPMATSQAFFNVVFTSDATRDFIYSRFQCAEVRHEWDAMVSTGTQPNLSGSKLKKWEISLPPLPEQRLIGQFFKTFDSLIAAAEERTRALKETKSAYLQRMFV